MSAPRFAAAPKLVGRPDDRRDARREILGVEPRNALTVDQETVAPQDDRCLDPFALSDRRDEVSNARHAHSSKSGAKLTVEEVEVKRGHRVEFARAGVYPTERHS